MKLKIQDLNLNALMHFHAVAKHRSLSLAAKELHLSAPAITHSLNNLETSLKETLCVRNRTSFSLTSAGLSLYQTTQNIFQELGKFNHRHQSNKDLSEILSIGTLDNFENPELTSAISKTINEFPNIKLCLQSYDSETINQLLLRNEIDIGFGVFSNHSPRIKYIKIGEERLCYYISNNHALYSKKKILKEDLIGQKVTWLDNHNRKKSDLELNIFVENLKYKMQFYGFSNNLSGALQILLSGHTVVPLPESFGKIIEKQYQVRKIDIQSNVKALDQVMAYKPSLSLSLTTKFMVDLFISKHSL